jgi:hypothetical protein
VADLDEGLAGCQAGRIARLEGRGRLELRAQERQVRGGPTASHGDIDGSRVDEAGFDRIPRQFVEDMRVRH